MDILFPHEDRDRLEFIESAINMGFEQLTAECTANVNLLEPHDRFSVLLLAWKKIGDYLTQNQYAPFVGKTVSWVGRYTLDLWFGSDWIACSTENKTSLIEHMMKVYPSAYLTMHPYSWPYMFSIYRAPWTIEYLNIHFQRMNGPDMPVELESKDSEFVQQEGILLIILRMINMFDFGMVKLVKHLCTRLLLIWHDPKSLAYTAMHATPNSAEYMEYVRHIHLIAICQSNADMQYMIGRIQRCLAYSIAGISPLDQVAEIIAKGLMESKKTLAEFFNGFLHKVPERRLGNMFGAAVEHYVMFITETQIRKLHAMSSMKLSLSDHELYEKLIQMFIKHRESSEELMKTTALVSERLFSNVSNLKVLQYSYKQVMQRTRGEWFSTKLTILLGILREEVNELEDLKYNDIQEADEIILKEQEVGTYFRDLAILLATVPYLEQEAWLTAFSLHPCKEYMDAVAKCGTRNLRAIKKQALKLKETQPKPVTSNLAEEQKIIDVAVQGGQLKSVAVQDEQLKNVAVAFQDEQLKSVAVAVQDERLKIVAVAIQEEQLKSVDVATQDEQLKSVAVAVQDEELKSVAVAIQDEQFKSAAVAIQDEQLKSVSILEEQLKSADLIENRNHNNVPEPIKPPVVLSYEDEQPCTSAAFLASNGFSLRFPELQSPAVEVKDEVKDDKTPIQAPIKKARRKPQTNKNTDPTVKGKRGRPFGSKSTKVAGETPGDLNAAKKKAAAKIPKIKNPAIAKPDAKDKDSADLIYAAAAGAATNLSSQTTSSIQYPAFALIHSVTDTEDLVKYTNYDDTMAQYNEMNNILNNLPILESNRNDLLILLIAPRYKRLSWVLCWRELRKRCRNLLNKPNQKNKLVLQYMADANSRLTHLHIDYDKFKDKPQMDYGTIEAGYERFDSELEVNTLKPVVADSKYTKLKQHENKPTRKPTTAKKSAAALNKTISSKEKLNVQKESGESCTKSESSICSGDTQSPATVTGHESRHETVEVLSQEIIPPDRGFKIIGNLLTGIIDVSNFSSPISLDRTLYVLPVEKTQADYHPLVNQAQDRHSAPQCSTDEDTLTADSCEEKCNTTTVKRTENLTTQPVLTVSSSKLCVSQQLPIISRNENPDQRMELNTNLYSNQSSEFVTPMNMSSNNGHRQPVALPFHQFERPTYPAPKETSNMPSPSDYLPQRLNIPWAGKQQKRPLACTKKKGKPSLLRKQTPTLVKRQGSRPRMMKSYNRQPNTEPNFSATTTKLNSLEDLPENFTMPKTPNWTPTMQVIHRTADKPLNLTSSVTASVGGVFLAGGFSITDDRKEKKDEIGDVQDLPEDLTMPKTSIWSTTIEVINRTPDKPLNLTASPTALDEAVVSAYSITDDDKEKQEVQLENSKDEPAVSTEKQKSLGPETQVSTSPKKEKGNYEEENRAVNLKAQDEEEQQIVDTEPVYCDLNDLLPAVLKENGLCPQIDRTENEAEYCDLDYFFPEVLEATQEVLYHESDRTGPLKSKEEKEQQNVDSICEPDLNSDYLPEALVRKKEDERENINIDKESLCKEQVPVEQVKQNDKADEPANSNQDYISLKKIEDKVKEWEEVSEQNATENGTADPSKDAEKQDDLCPENLSKDDVSPADVGSLQQNPSDNESDGAIIDNCPTNTSQPTQRETAEDDEVMTEDSKILWRPYEADLEKRKLMELSNDTVEGAPTSIDNKDEAIKTGLPEACDPSALDAAVNVQESPAVSTSSPPSLADKDNDDSQNSIEENRKVTAVNSTPNILLDEIISVPSPSPSPLTDNEAPKTSVENIPIAESNQDATAIAVVQDSNENKTLLKQSPSPNTITSDTIKATCSNYKKTAPRDTDKDEAQSSYAPEDDVLHDNSKVLNNHLLHPGLKTYKINKGKDLRRNKTDSGDDESDDSKRPEIENESLPNTQAKSSEPVLEFMSLDDTIENFENITKINELLESSSHEPQPPQLPPEIAAYAKYDPRTQTLVLMENIAFLSAFLAEQDKILKEIKAEGQEYFYNENSASILIACPNKLDTSNEALLEVLEDLVADDEDLQIMTEEILMTREAMTNIGDLSRWLRSIFKVTVSKSKIKYDNTSQSRVVDPVRFLQEFVHKRRAASSLTLYSPMLIEYDLKNSQTIKMFKKEFSAIDIKNRHTPSPSPPHQATNPQPANFYSEIESPDATCPEPDAAPCATQTEAHDKGSIEKATKTKPTNRPCPAPKKRQIRKMSYQKKPRARGRARGWHEGSEDDSEDYVPNSRQQRSIKPMRSRSISRRTNTVLKNIAMNSVERAAYKHYNCQSLEVRLCRLTSHQAEMCRKPVIKVRRFPIVKYLKTLRTSTLYQEQVRAIKDLYEKNIYSDEEMEVELSPEAEPITLDDETNQGDEQQLQPFVYLGISDERINANTSEIISLDFLESEGEESDAMFDPLVPDISLISSSDDDYDDNSPRPTDPTHVKIIRYFK